MNLKRNHLHSVLISGALTALIGFAATATAAAAPVAPDYPTEIGPGEGELNIVAWEGYAQDEWVKPFEKKTGCEVNRKYAGSSDEMVALMRQGGGSEYDLVSASGDAALRLIYGGDVQPINVDLIPAFEHFLPQLKSPPHNTINDIHYGLSYQWGPNVLIYNTEAVKEKPTSWSVIYSDQYKNRITVPNNPIQIADAALYLMAHKPELGISDPYELTEEQLAAAVDLLQKQRPLIKKYWSFASTEITLFKNGGVVIGAGWPYQTNTLQAAGVAVKDTIPKEGATGWADSWMLSANSDHVNCAYMWMKYTSTPEVQAMQALYFGSTPANEKACSVMNEMDPGSCDRLHLNEPASYYEKIWFWRTPRTDCGDGNKQCTSYRDWQRAWRTVTG